MRTALLGSATDLTVWGYRGSPLYPMQRRSQGGGMPRITQVREGEYPVPML